MSSVRKTFLLPESLAQGLDEEAMASGQSANAILVARLQAEAALRREKERLAAEAQKLGAEVVRLKADLATRPPPHFQDSLLRRTPGTAKLLDERDAAREECRKLEAALAEAGQDAEEWRDSSAAWEEQCEALEDKLKRSEAHRDRLALRLKEKEALLEARVADLSKRSADHEARLERVSLTAFRRGMLAGVPMVAVLAGLLLFLLPADTSAMRFVASAAMGATMEPERAAARLHGQHLGGFQTQVQLYALAHTGKNGERLVSCFRRASEIPEKARRQTVDCTIQVPGRLVVESTLLLKGPFELEKPLRRQLRDSDTAEINTAPAQGPTPESPAYPRSGPSHNNGSAPKPLHKTRALPTITLASSR